MSDAQELKHEHVVYDVQHAAAPWTHQLSGAQNG
jgi:hypothetical protein